MSNGEKSGSTGTPAKPKKKMGFALAKEKYEKEIADLKRQLAEQQNAPAATVAPEPAPPPVTIDVSDSEDCLDFITEDTPYVSLVSTYTTISLRPGNVKMNPHMFRIVSTSDNISVWDNCPFHIGDRTSEENDQRIRLAKKAWWKHTISRETAEAVYDDERWKRPTRTAICPADFEGWDSSARAPRGKLTEITEFIPLREVVRIALMRLRETFLDYGRRPQGFHFDPRIVNPYRNKVAGLQLKTATPHLAPEDLE